MNRKTAAQTEAIDWRQYIFNRNTDMLLTYNHSIMYIATHAVWMERGGDRAEQTEWLQMVVSNRRFCPAQWQPTLQLRVWTCACKGHILSGWCQEEELLTSSKKLVSWPRPNACRILAEIKKNKARMDFVLRILMTNVLEFHEHSLI